MSKKSTIASRKRPDGLSLRDAMRDHNDRTGGQKGLRKQAVSMKAAEGGDLLVCDSMIPTDEQLDKVNQFTRSTKSAEEVLVFPTMSCNNMYDRDDEAFRMPGGKSAIKQMHDLEPPYSFVGKSFMMDHDYTVSKAIGRIFDEEVTTETLDGQSIEFLKHWVYMPNTEQFKGIAEKIDFGVQWAVSVGLVIESTACTVCDSPMLTSRWMGMSFCTEYGHEKGLWYDPDSTETDDWGWAAPVPEGTSGAVKCQMNMYDPKDGYELSSVFLGAQYYAELAKRPDFKGLVKAASAGVPIIGLSSKEAEALSIPHEPEAVREARSKYTVMVDDDGDPTWTDDAGLKWVYDTQADKVFSLGKDANDQEDVDGTEGSGDGSTSSGEVVRSDGDEVPVGDDAVAEDGLGGLEDGQSGGSEEGGEELGTGSGVEDSSSNSDDEEKQAAATAFLLIARNADLPQDLLEKAAEHSKKGPDAVVKALLVGAAAQIKQMERTSILGDQFLKTLKADAIAWYVKAHKDADTKGVDTTIFEKMLDRVGDDTELLQEMIEEQKGLARAKFPQSVRRSSFESDANQATGVDDIDVDDLRDKDRSRTDETVRSIHR